LKKILATAILSQTLLFGGGEVLSKVKNLIDIKSYQSHYNLISRLFADERRFFKDEKLEIIEILKKLKDEGVLNLQLEKPETIKISFSGKGNATFLIKIASASLQESGYYKYRISEVKRDENGFLFSVNFPSQQIPDPTIILEFMKNKGAKIIDVTRNSNISWKYSIELNNKYSETIRVTEDRKQLKRPTSDYWLEFKEEGILEILSKANDWHPEIFFYDENLKLIKVFKKDAKRIKLRLKIPNNIKYAKVSDIYHLENIKNGLSVSLEKIRR
jgi:hypothetical protein